MADFPGSIVDLEPLAAPPGPSPQARGRSVVGARRALPEETIVLDDIKGAEFTAAGGVTPPGAGGADHAGASQEITVGRDWFEAVHLLPRQVDGVDFGNIITTVQDEYEIFNAHTAPANLTTIVNNAGAGITLPNLPTPVDVLDAFCSYLDPSSTRLSPVKTKVQADPNGPANFDTTIDFTFSPGGTVQLFVAGSRIVLIPFDWEKPFDEFLQFKTGILTKQDGGEQRSGKRAAPRQLFDLLYRLQGREKRRMKSLLHGWQARQFALPLKHEGVPLTAAVSSGVSVSVLGAADCDFRIGGLAVVFKDNDTFDVLTIATKSDTTITFSSAIQNSYSVGEFVYPVRTAHIAALVRGSRPPKNVENFRIRFRVVDNTTGVLTGDATPFSTYKTKVLLDECNLLEGGSLDVSRQARTVVIDNETGVVTQLPVWVAPKRDHQKGFFVQDRARMIEVRRLLTFLDGPRISFWIPTFDEDLLPTQDITSASDKLVIENVGYARFVGGQEQRRDIRATFTDGSQIEREIQSAIEIDDDEEELTLDTTWGVNKTVSEISRVEFLENVRFSGDEFRIRHEGIGRAKVFSPVRRVFD